MAVREILGATGIGLGGGPLGNLYHAISDEQAHATVHAAWQAGVRFFDTAPHYGIGLAEKRLGQALGGYPREQFAVCTKVGRRLVAQEPQGRTDLPNGFDVPATHRRVWDFTAAGVERALEESLTRLGLARVDIALIHDPEASPSPQEALRQAFPALAELRRQGLVRAIGVGSGDLGTLALFAEQADVDMLMVAGQYTLLRQEALRELLPACERAGITVMNAGVFNGGLLASESPDEGGFFDYRKAPAEMVRRARAAAAVCARHGVSLPHAAVAFAAGHPAIACVVVGAQSPEQIEQAVRWRAAPVAAQLWEELAAEGLLSVLRHGPPEQ